MAKHSNSIKLVGIIDNTFSGFTCIRGYAERDVLTKISKADEQKYQRQLDNDQVKKIEKFLSSGDYMFFPEIILALPLYFDNARFREVEYNQDKTYNPIEEIYNKGFKSNVIDLKVKGKKGNLATLTINHDYTKNHLIELTNDDKYIFARIDGNHRLSAMSHISDVMVGKKVPFCIILLPNDGNEKKTEYVLFNNINSKGKSLNDYEKIKGLISGGLFSESELENQDNFDNIYLYCKKFIDNFNKKEGFELQQILKNIDDLVKFAFDFYSLCIAFKIEFNFANFTNNIFTKIIRLDEVVTDIKVMESVIIIDLMKYDYYDFINWMNKTEIANSMNSIDIINVYITKMKCENKDVFYSLSIMEKGSADRYNAVSRAVDKINKIYNIGINLTRIDIHKEGESFEISDKITDCIKASGLLIADLTGGNANVAHEIGFIMGYNEFAKVKKSANILITIQPNENGISRNIPSNIRQHRAMVYDDISSLESEIFDELKAKYVKS